MERIRIARESSSISLIIFVSLALYSMADEVKTEAIKVAVIGSGVGGASCSHFLRRLLGKSAKIDVFERNTLVGGRAAVVKLDSFEYEAGGAVIHSKNKYMVDFTKYCDLRKRKDQNSRFGIYDGKGFVFQESSWKVITMFKMFWRYGWSLLSMDNLVSDAMSSFVKIYEVQDKGEAFDDVKSLLDSTGDPRLYSMTQKSSRMMLQENKVSDLVINELFVAISRTNYGQNANLTGLTGFVSLAGGQSGHLWAVNGGNYLIPKNLLEKADVNLHLNSPVTEITKVNPNSDQVAKYQLKVDGKMLSTKYDAVVVAVPMEINDDFILCDKCSKWPKKGTMGHYQKTVATFVKGNLSAKRFGYEKEQDVPGEIVTTESPLNFFSSVGRNYPVSDGASQTVYKVFSRQPLTKSQMGELFSTIEETKEINWLAYPHYTPPEKFESFVLDNGVFFVNPIERAASAMEMSAISGRNAALLVRRYLKQIKRLATDQENKNANTNSKEL